LQKADKVKSVDQTKPGEGWRQLCSSSHLRLQKADKVEMYGPNKPGEGWRQLCSSSHLRLLKAEKVEKYLLTKPNLMQCGGNLLLFFPQVAEG
jgi:hypothetical protein